MRRVRDTNDADAFALLCARYRPGLRAYFAALLPPASRSSADDMAQETLLRLWLSRDRWEPSGKFSAYLFQIGRHYFLNQRERYQSRATREISADVSGETGDGIVLFGPARTQPEAVLLEQWETARIGNAVGRLPPACRDVFILSHFEGLAQREIACRLNIPVGTVKSRLFDAVRRLRTQLAADLDKEEK